MIIKCEINAREKFTTAMEQERYGKNVFSSEETLSVASLFAGQKSKCRTKCLIQVHENNF